MKRTISAEVGKGSVNHNSRKFKAANVDPERTHLNIEYCNEPIKQVYHKLFDEALERYNAKQTRSDRRIDDYYEKIRTGKQEKPFHELIIQIGNRDDTSSGTEIGEQAKAALDEYFQGFRERNPNLYVFSAHLHMDEATPHKENEHLIASNDRLKEENTALREQNKDYALLRKVFGSKQVDNLVAQAREAQQAKRLQRQRSYDYER